MQTTSPRHHFAPIVVWPFLLIGVGVAALMVNTGAITWDSVGRIAGLWPLLLIVVGIELIISRAAPAVIALPANLAVSVLALVGVLALLLSGASFSIGNWWPAAQVQTISRSAPLAQVSQAQLSVNYAAADIKIHAGSIGADLYRANLTYAGKPAPSIWVDQTSGTLHVERGSKSAFQILPANTHEQVDLVLSDRVPWSVTINTGASQQTLDFRGLTVSSLRVNGGATGMEIDLAKPVGATAIRINGGAMSLKVVAPSGAAVQMTADGGFTSLTCDGQAISGFGRQTWQSANYAASSDRYDVQFSGGASSVRLERW